MMALINSCQLCTSRTSGTFFSGFASFTSRRQLYKQFLGYEKGPDDLPQIVEEQAAIVRRIYSMFMYGKTTSAIAKQLTREGVPTPAGKKTWQASTIESILTNEKYKGAALLQKSFTVDFLTKTMKRNEGEVPQYYIEHIDTGRDEL